MSWKIGLTSEDNVVVEQVNELMVKASGSMLELPMNDPRVVPLMPHLQKAKVRIVLATHKDISVAFNINKSTITFYNLKV
jgi:hypothetical protein